MPGMPSGLPVLSDSSRRRRFLRAALGCWLGMGGLALASLLFFPQQTSFMLTITGITVGSGALIAALLHFGYLRLACLTFCVTVNCAFFGLALLIHRVDALSTDAIMTRVSCLALSGVAIVFSGALIGRWAGFIFAACNTAVLAGLLQFDPLFAPQVSIPFFWWVLAVAVSVYESLVTDTLTRLEAAHNDLERAVDERTADLHRTIAELREAKAEIDAANSDLQAFAGAASHDLRSPLTGIMGFADMLQLTLKQKITAEELTRLGYISELSQKMAVIIEDFLRLARANRVNLSLAAVQVSAMAKEAADQLAHQHPQRVAEWHISPLITVHADPGMVRIVVDNLLHNAWKYSGTRERTIITIAAIEQQGMQGFSVADNGVGFSMHDAGCLFQPFVRLHDASAFPGTGIGLATVQRIIKRHGGRIWVEAEPGRGATFFVLFGDPASAHR